MPDLFLLDSAEQVRQYLIIQGWFHDHEALQVDRLSGGVSSSVWKITTSNGRWVIKQALEKLNVQAEWFADVERIHREHEVMEMLCPIVSPRSIPQVRHADYQHHTYLMDAADEGAVTWKDMLMDKHFSVSVAQQAGALLAEMHGNSRGLSSDNIAKLQNQKYFIQLRVDPFHYHLMKRYPELALSIQKLVDDVTLNPTCLVHGDFSPKNMLVEQGEHLVLIDFEVAHWGNPVYDLSYCIGHLLLKAWYLNQSLEILQLVRALLTAYGDQPSRLMPHLGLMLLARLDGKSPVNYLKDEKQREEIRRVAIGWIGLPFEGNQPMQDMAKAFGIKE